MGKIVAIPDWASPALQGLCFWLGSQHTLGLAANISEGAIAWELMRLVFTHRLPDRHLEAEVFYRHIPEFLASGVANDSRERADLAIAKKARMDRGTSYATGDVEAVIEVKHSRSRKDLIWQDIDYLGERRSKSPAVRAFLIYASINERPEDFTNIDGSAITPRYQVTPSGTKYRVRRVCRATKIIPSKNKNATGHYAILIEVAPPHSKAANDA
ncbi:hypothetical protein [Inhella proteolytica]|uniref:Uncharacterized protein n=1 Tax=Inhella proteolytica TaxID=2795029 RepID=A0A931IYA6_9BURK|nr:hypothetical protein [Inhella proteolytica]MBH9575273.1 hypothetical protein [Inhella proteolytica]